MRHPHILRIHRLIDPVRKIEPNGQLDPRHRLEPREDRLGRNRAAGDEAVAMVPVRIAKDAIRRDGAPEAEIVHRLKPVLHILNVFKHKHGASVPDRRPHQQIYGEKP